MAMQDTQGDDDIFSQHPPPPTPGGAAPGPPQPPSGTGAGNETGHAPAPANAAYAQIAAWYRQYYRREPTQADLAQWGPHPDANYLRQIQIAIARSAPNTPPAPPAAAATPTAAGSGGPNAFRDAWLASGGKNVTDLAKFAKDHPELGGTVTGSKGSKVTFANGQTFQAVRSAGLDGGIAGVWDDLSQENSAPAQAGFAAPPGSALPDFVAPTGLTEQNDPGYQARLALGEQGVQRGLAAQGIAHTGGALKDLMGYDQTYASNEFGNVWGRALQDYGTKYGKATDTYNRAKGEYDTKFGNLFSLSQLDSQNQNALNSLNLGYAGLFGNIFGNSATNFGNLTTGQGNANAAGRVGSGNAWASLFGSGGNDALAAYLATRPRG